MLLSQVKLMPLGLDNLILIDDDARRQAYEVGQGGGSGVTIGEGDKKRKPWGVGEMDFEALMRMLDNAVSWNLELRYIFLVPMST